MQEKTGIIRRGDAVYHGAIDPIVNLGAVFVCAGSFTFQLVLSLAMLANVVFNRRICFGSVYGVFAADGAVHVAGEPVFCEDAGLLGGAFVALNQGGVEG